MNTIQYTDDILLNCTPGTYILLLTSVTSIKNTIQYLKRNPLYIILVPFKKKKKKERRLGHRQSTDQEVVTGRYSKKAASASQEERPQKEQTSWNIDLGLQSPELRENKVVI